MYFNIGRCVRVCRAAYLWRWWSYVHLIQASGAGSTPTPSQYFQTLFGEWMSTRPEWERMCCLCYIDLVAASSVVHYNTAQVTGRVALGGRQEERQLHKGAVRLNRKCTGALNIYSTPQDSLKPCGNDPAFHYKHKPPSPSKVTKMCINPNQLKRRINKSKIWRTSPSMQRIADVAGHSLLDLTSASFVVVTSDMMLTHCAHPSAAVLLTGQLTRVSHTVIQITIMWPCSV